MSSLLTSVALAAAVLIAVASPSQAGQGRFGMKPQGQRALQNYPTGPIKDQYRAQGRADGLRGPALQQYVYANAHADPRWAAAKAQKCRMEASAIGGNWSEKQTNKYVSSCSGK